MMDGGMLYAGRDDRDAGSEMRVSAGDGILINPINYLRGRANVIKEVWATNCLRFFISRSLICIRRTSGWPLSRTRRGLDSRATDAALSWRSARSYGRVHSRLS